MTVVAERPTLSGRVAGFLAHLRGNGFAVGPAETETALRVLADGDAPTLSGARERLKVLLTGRRGEWERFDDLFEAYWVGGGRLRVRPAWSSRSGAPSRATSNLWGERAGDADEMRGVSPIEQEGWGGGAGDAPEVEGIARELRAASARHASTRADLRHIVDRQEMAQAEAVAFRLARAMRYRLSRRHRVAARGRRIDLRRSIRRNLAHGGDPLTLVRRNRPDRPVRIVVMLDVSGSMQPYVRYLLQFVRGLAATWEPTDAYLFNTRLTRITDVLREKDALLAMSRLALMAPGFGGGTRMSDCLATFNEQHAKRALGSRSVFLMLSDGYDTGEPAACAAELARLRRRARKLFWLNPMLGWDGYRPETRTMQAALEHVDVFAPAHSLEALGALEQRLAAA